MLQTNLDTLLFCSNLRHSKLLQVSEYGPWPLESILHDTVFGHYFIKLVYV
jgi:hypothetical protein